MGGFWLPIDQIVPFSGKIFFDKSVNSLILNVYRQKIFSQLLKLFGSGSSGLWTGKNISEAARVCLL